MKSYNLLNLEKNHVVFDEVFWFDIINNSQTISILNDFALLFFDSFINYKTLQTLLHNNNFKKLNIVLESKFSKTENFYLTNQNSNLNDFLNNYENKINNQIIELLKLSNKIEIKISPFSKSQNLLKTDNQIYVFFENYKDLNSEISIINILKENENIYNHFNEIVENSINSQLNQTILLDNNNKIILPEFLQIIDDKGNTLTKLPRKFVESENNKYFKTNGFDFAHRHIFCFVVSTKNKILVQKRADNKDNPSMWDKSLGGHVDFEETTVQACIRELNEELNIEFNPKKHRLTILKSELKPTENNRVLSDFTNILETSANDIFLLSNVENSEIKIDNNEVKGFKWLDFKEIKQLLLTENVTYDLIKLINEYKILDLIELQLYNFSK